MKGNVPFIGSLAELGILMQTNETNEHRNDFYSIFLWLEYILNIYWCVAVNFIPFYSVHMYMTSE